MNKDETYEETLKREIEEETGYKATKVKEKIGEIIERKFDDYEVGAVFEMKSTYYLCDVSDEKSEQKLDDYELELDFRPVWIPINEVLNINKKEIETESNNKNPWLERETMVLENLNKFVAQKKEKQYNFDVDTI